MIVIWHFYWPAVAAALVVGIIAGRYGFHKELPLAIPGGTGPEPPPPVPGRSRRILLAGLAAALVLCAFWHWATAANRFVAFVEQAGSAELRHQEMTTVTAKLERGPLRRTFLLDGPADPFQRGELVRIMGSIPGAATARWSNPPLGGRAILPLIAEAEIMAVIGFLFGLLLAYLLELRRRSNAQWRW